jgi:hypothetical protein
VELIRVDLEMSGGNFAALYGRVRTCPVSERLERPDVSEKVCAAVDMACIWYWKRVLCLQRSVATACLLKRRGVPALMMIGAQQMPFRSHAWVEVDGRVVNDKPYMREMYAVLDRC